MKKYTHWSRRLLGGVAAVALLATGAAPALAQSAESSEAAENQTESERLNAWYDEQFQMFVQRFPTFLTSLGIPARQDEWNDATEEFSQETFELGQTLMWEMRTQFNYDELDPDTQLSYRLYEAQTEQNALGFAFRNHGYTFNQMFGPHTGMPALLMNQHRVNSVEDAENYIARLNGMQAQMDQLISNAERDFAAGIGNAPRFVYERVIVDAQGIVTGAPFDDSDEPSALLADITGKIEALDADQEVKDDLLARATEALETSVGSAYAALITQMESHRDRAGTDDGIWHLENGDAYYTYLLNQFTTTNLNADEIHRIGLAQVDRIHEEMRAIMEQVEFDGSLQEFFEFMKTDEQFYEPSTDEGRQAYLDRTDVVVEAMYDRLPELFNRLPQADLIVRQAESFRDTPGGAFYEQPALDGSRPGTYFVSLNDMSAAPLYQLEALAYHEAVPGHHMQIAIAQELEGVPMFRRFGGYTAYIEGWGLYSEEIPIELGFYSDPYSNFGRLAMELWRAARLVVDTGLHYHRWTREEAIEYLNQNTPGSEAENVGAIERYIVMPGQATAYMIGKLKIMELRAMATEALGDDFDIREFHDEILGSGAVPLDVLEERINAWVAEQLESPA